MDAPQQQHAKRFEFLRVISGTDGYEVLFSLAELDPAYGAPEDLAPYADTEGQFPGDGFARDVIPGDNHQGRWVSNVDLIEVASVPEPNLTGCVAGALILSMVLLPWKRKA